MELELFWTNFAEKELKVIFDFHKEKAGKKVALKIINGIVNESIKLKKTPKIGQEEELLLHREQGFRYIVVKNYKIIYWTNLTKDRVEITDIFDTRQNPNKIDKNE